MARLLEVDHFNCKKCGYEFLIITPPRQCAVNYCPHCGKILREVHDDKPE